MTHKNTLSDMTIIYYTANVNSEYFMKNTQKMLLDAIGDTPIISVSFKPTVIGKNCVNICIGEQERSNYMLYKQVLMGVRLAKTKYVAMAEDDTLYSPEHFQYRPPEGTVAYDLNRWSIFSWTTPPIFSKREDRKTMNLCVADRSALLRVLEDRYAKYPVLSEIPKDVYKYYWGEPGRFENHLGVPIVEMVKYDASVPSIMFSTSEALGYLYLGKRKAHGPMTAEEIPYWGKAEDILKLYKA